VRKKKCGGKERTYRSGWRISDTHEPQWRCLTPLNFFVCTMMVLEFVGVQGYDDGGSDFGVRNSDGQVQKEQSSNSYKGRKGVERSKFSTKRKPHWCRLTKTL